MFSWLFLSQLVLADVTLKVRPQTFRPPGTAITLDTLVDGAGLGADVRARLQETTVGEALAPDERRELEPRDLMPLLRAAMEELKSEGPVHLDLPPTIVVSSRSKVLSEDQITRDLLAAWQPLCADCQISVENLSLPRVDRVRDYRLRIKSELPRGSFSLPLELTRENGTTVPAWVNGRLSVKRRVPVAKRSLNINERVGEADLSWEYRDVSQAYDGVPETADLANKHMRQALRAGDVLFSGFLEKEKAVHRGEVVQVIAGEGEWQVSVNATANQDAALGDWIQLRGAKGATLEGQVTAQGEVRLR